MGVVALAIGICGLLLVNGVAPEPVGFQLTGEALPAVATPTSEPAPTTTPVTSEPVATSTPATTEPSPTTTTTTTTLAAVPGPFPTSVTANPDLVGPGGSVEFAGTCPTIDGTSRGPLVVRHTTTTPDGTSTMLITTDSMDAAWTFSWTFAADIDEFSKSSPNSFQFWCGEPDDTQPYPDDLVPRIEFVVLIGPPTTTTTTTTNVESLPVPVIVIPETD